MKTATAKREKTVYSTDEIAHLWASGEKAYARNSQGNHSFENAALYSYTTVIARLVTHRGQTAALLADQSWSSTTNKHQWSARRAVSHLPHFTVVDWNANPDHRRNLANYNQKITDAGMAAKRARANGAWRLKELIRYVDEANAYAAFFGLQTRFAAPSLEESAAIIEKTRLATKKAKKKKAVAEAERATYLAGRVPQVVAAWRQGIDLPTQDEDRKYQLTFEEVRTYYGGDLLRVDPTASTLVQTIRNVRVPLAHVQRALRIVVPMLHAHETYQRNGHSINVGEFKLDSINAEGTVRCGCHTFPRAEVLRFAASIASIESPIDSISPENEAPQGA